ncbi:hypothetical protein ACLB1O_29355 [Escherichia coli]
MLKVSVLLSVAQTVAALTVDVEVLLILEIALKHEAFTIAMQFFCGFFLYNIKGILVDLY